MQKVKDISFGVYIFFAILLSMNCYGQSEIKESEIVTYKHYVHIVGEVDNPGLYQFAPGTRLGDVIKMATGGYKKKTIVELRRDESILCYNISRYYNFGDLTQSPFLIENDILYVAPDGYVCNTLLKIN